MALTLRSKVEEIAQLPDFSRFKDVIADLNGYTIGELASINPSILSAGFATSGGMDKAIKATLFLELLKSLVITLRTFRHVREVVDLEGRVASKDDPGLHLATIMPLLKEASGQLAGASDITLTLAGNFLRDEDEDDIVAVVELFRDVVHLSVDLSNNHIKSTGLLERLGKLPNVCTLNVALNQCASVDLKPFWASDDGARLASKAILTPLPAMLSGKAWLSLFENDVARKASWEVHVQYYEDYLPHNFDPTYPTT